MAPSSRARLAASCVRLRIKHEHPGVGSLAEHQVEIDQAGCRRPAPDRSGRRGRRGRAAHRPGPHATASRTSGPAGRATRPQLAVPVAQPLVQDHRDCESRSASLFAIDCVRRILPPDTPQDCIAAMPSYRGTTWAFEGSGDGSPQLRRARASTVESKMHARSRSGISQRAAAA